MKFCAPWSKGWGPPQYFVWAAWSDNRVFALYVMLLPLFYGYVAPGIATNLLHKWRFK
jgi:hypothetical protein